MITGQWNMQKRRLPSWRPGVNGHRKQRKPSFINPENGGLLLFDFFLSGPALFLPLFDGCFIALTGSRDGLVPTPPMFAQKPTNMVRMIGDAKRPRNDFGDPACCPHIPAKTVGFRSFCQQRG
jgi:hypothetical protein